MMNSSSARSSSFNLLGESQETPSVEEEVAGGGNQDAVKENTMSESKNEEPMQEDKMGEKHNEIVDQDPIQENTMCEKHIEEPRIGERGQHHKNSIHISSGRNKDAVLLTTFILWVMVSMIYKGEKVFLMDFKFDE